MPAVCPDRRFRWPRQQRKLRKELLTMDCHLSGRKLLTALFAFGVVTIAAAIPRGPQSRMPLRCIERDCSTDWRRGSARGRDGGHPCHAERRSAQ